MKPIGAVKRIDNLNRILLPKELRKLMPIKTGDQFEIFVDDNSIILKKYEPTCMFCNSTEDVTEFKGKGICKQCMQELDALK